MNRRSLITSLISLVAAPAIVRASNLMPVRFMFDSEHIANGIFPPSGGWTEASGALTTAHYPTIELGKYTVVEMFHGSERRIDLVRVKFDADSVTVQDIVQNSLHIPYSPTPASSRPC